MILLKACMYQVNNAKGHVYNLRTPRDVRIRLAMLKKGCFWGFVANEDDKEDKNKKEKKKAEPTKPEEQSKKVKDKKLEKAKPPNSALKKLKMEEEDDEILPIKPMRKAPRSTVMEKEDDANDEYQSQDKSTSSPSGTGNSSSPSSSSDRGSSSTWTESPLLRADEAPVTGGRRDRTLYADSPPPPTLPARFWPRSAGPWAPKAP